MGERGPAAEAAGPGPLALPPGAVRRQTPLYDEVLIPAVKAQAPPGERLVSIEEFDDWAQLAFTGVPGLLQPVSGTFILRQVWERQLCQRGSRQTGRKQSTRASRGRRVEADSRAGPKFTAISSGAFG